MGNASEEKMGDSGVLEMTGKIMVVAVAVLFFIVLFFFLLHLYTKWFCSRRLQDARNTTRQRRRFDFAPGYQEVTVTAAVRKGLEPSVLKTLPVVVFNSKDFNEGLECAVCLSDLSEGEKARLLPKCNHGFHLDCIDMWFQSHSTCPLCRNPVSNQLNSSSASQELSSVELNPLSNELPVDSPNFPTNVLFWGNENQVRTLGNVEEVSEQPSSSSSAPPPSSSNRPDGMTVIDIPSHVDEEEEHKSPAPTRLRSLKRLLSRDRRISPCGTSNVDLEEGT